MIQAARLIGTGLATTGLIGAGIGIGTVFGALIIVYKSKETEEGKQWSLKRLLSKERIVANIEGDNGDVKGRCDSY